MLSENKAVNAIFRYFKGKISKSWIKGNLAKYLAIYEVRENGMVVPLPESPKDSCIGKAINFAKDLIDEIKEAVTVTASDLKDEVENGIANDDESENGIANDDESENGIAKMTTSSVKDKDEHTKYSDEEIKENLCNLRISFAKTQKELLSGKKTQTRRRWTQKHAEMMKKSVGKVIKASKDWYGLKPLCYLKINAIYAQKLSEMTYADVCAEGFEHFSPQDFINQFFGGDNSLEVWVVEFEVVKYLDKPWEKVQKLTQKWLSPEEEKLKAQQNRMIQQKRIVDEKVTLERANYLKSLDNSLGVTQ